MDIRSIRSRAAKSLAAAPGQPQRVAAVYAGIACVLSLVMSLISYLLGTAIAKTGGLSNLGMRAILSTARASLPFLQMLVMLCVTMGYRIAVLRMARGQETEPAMLTAGFRVFGPVLRMTLIQAFLYFAIAVAAAQLSSCIYLMLPASAEYYTLMQSLAESGSILGGAALDEGTLLAVAQAMRPMMLIAAAIFILLAFPVVYRYRLADYALADEPRRGALYAMRTSRIVMRGKVMRLLRLDLSFWWYYLAEIALGVLAYGDVLLAMTGLTLPVSAPALSFLFLVLSLLSKFALYYFALNRVSVTYASVYEALRPEPQMPPVQQNV